MKFNYYLSPAAEQDIEGMINYLAQENVDSAHTFLDAVYGAMELIAENPDIGHLREDLTSMPVKFWPFKWHYLNYLHPNFTG